MGPRMTHEQALAALELMTDEDFPTVAPEDDVSDDYVAALVEAGRRAAGRPSLTAPGAISPRINLRIPQALKDRLSSVAERQHRRESDVARDALEAYLSAA